jgi:hypothetical protein
MHLNVIAGVNRRIRLSSNAPEELTISYEDLIPLASALLLAYRDGQTEEIDTVVDRIVEEVTQEAA